MPRFDRSGLETRDSIDAFDDARPGTSRERVAIERDVSSTRWSRARVDRTPRRREAVERKRKRRAERAVARRRTSSSASFRNNNRNFRALLEKSKTLSPPVGGDATAVKAYAAKKLAILKEVRSDDAPRDDAPRDDGRGGRFARDR